MKSLPTPKAMSVIELTRINEEWTDSKVVCDLLAHIQHLNQVIVEQASNMVASEEGK